MAVLVAYEPLLSYATKVVCGSNNSDNTFEVTKLDLAFLVSCKLMVFVKVCGSGIHKPFVHHLHL